MSVLSCMTLGHSFPAGTAALGAVHLEPFQNKQESQVLGHRVPKGTRVQEAICRG